MSSMVKVIGQGHLVIKQLGVDVSPPASIVTLVLVGFNGWHFLANLHTKFCDPSYKTSLPRVVDQQYELLEL